MENNVWQCEVLSFTISRYREEVVLKCESGITDQVTPQSLPPKIIFFFKLSKKKTKTKTKTQTNKHQKPHNYFKGALENQQERGNV